MRLNLQYAALSILAVAFLTFIYAFRTQDDTLVQYCGVLTIIGASLLYVSVKHVPAQ